MKEPWKILSEKETLGAIADYVSSKYEDCPGRISISLNWITREVQIFGEDQNG